ncbi:hypothetical protein BJX70DRAFT_262146 [Aspergillus crustosus]
MLLLLRRSRICFLLIIIIVAIVLSSLPHAIRNTHLSPTHSPLTLIIAATSHDTFTSSSLPDLGLNPETDSLVIYYGDELTAPFRPPVNQGGEAISHLTYLIDHYDDLPDVMVFMHADSQAWHRNLLLARDARLTMRYLRRGYVLERGWVSLLCERRGLCASHPVYLDSDSEERDWESGSLKKEFTKAWGDLMGRDVKAPESVRSPTGSQFALTATQVKKHATKKQLMRLKDWIMNTSFSSEIVGSLFEYLWPYLFLGPGAEQATCPDEPACYCQMYGICFNEGDGTSEIADKALQEYFDLLGRRDELIQHLLKLHGSWGAVQSEIQEVRRDLEEVDDLLNLNLHMAVDRGLWMYPLDIDLDVDRIDILGVLPQYD